MAASDLGDIASGLDRGIPGVEHVLTPRDIRPRGPSFQSVEDPIMNPEPAHSVTFNLDPFTYDITEAMAVDAAGVSAFSPQALSQSDLLNITPFDWYDLLAQDAISNIQRQNNLNGEFQWSFDERSLSRKQSPVPEALDDQHGDTHGQNELPSQRQQLTSATHPWNTADNIELTAQDMEFFDHYVRVIGPILDLFDQERHFTNVVPHLAIRNIGLLKSLLAVAARHKSLSYASQSSETLSSPAITTSSPTGPRSAHLATQYYYETLQYLSQTLLYPQYAYSLEILATAIMITQYEMYDARGGTSNNGDWERHLRGAFWIQRSQDNDGEMVDGLRRAVWWAWVRQDIWAAFRAGRPALTIWRPKKRLDELTADELAWRIVYIAAKCVGYAATTSLPEQSLAQRVEQGGRLLKMLQEWYDLLPASYRPLSMGPVNAVSSSSAERPPTSEDSISGQISGVSGSEPAMSHATPTTTPSAGPAEPTSSTTVGQSWPGSSTQFTPIWIHPQNYAGAVQMYHFAKSLVLVNQPTAGGLSSYRRRQRTLNESLHTICGIAKTCREDDYAMAFVNVQAVFAGEDPIFLMLPLWLAVSTDLSSRPVCTDERETGRGCAALGQSAGRFAVPIQKSY